MKTLIAILSITTFFAQATYARNWEKIKIPGAVCGDGLPYQVFVDKKADTKNLLIEFMGGGACWSDQTCWGLNFRTWIHPIPEAPFFSYMTSDYWGWSTHPFRGDSAIYLPYCTGDVFSADHVANYDGKKVHHQGYRNVVMAFAYLKEKNIISFKDLERVTVWGASAGAIGVLVHLNNLEPYFAKETVKIAVIDSAGLHFGPTFWQKFTPELFSDYQQTFAKIGLNVTADDGFLAPNMGPVFSKLSNWTIGILQATRDEVMSTVFGDIAPRDHRRLILSNQGLPAVAKNYANVHTWVSDSDMHTFLLLKSSSYMDDMENKSAINFVNQLVYNAEGLKATQDP